MSVVQHLPTTTAVACVLGGAGAARDRVADLIRDADFAISPQPLPGSLIVFVAPRNEPERLREIRALVERDPHASVLVVMPASTANASLRRALIAGAAGIVLEDEMDTALAANARAILAGQLAVPSALGRHIAPRPLSHREKQILGLVVLGLTNREIANRLYLAESTVKTHLSSAFRKIDARSRSEAVVRIQDPESDYGPAILALAAGASAAPAF
jgi:DNA-binding NarL/FixJ family response regulator